MVTMVKVTKSMGKYIFPSSFVERDNYGCRDALTTNFKSQRLQEWHVYLLTPDFIGFFGGVRVLAELNWGLLRFQRKFSLLR